MQIQSTGQTQALAQSTPAQVRKMDGSGNGQGFRDSSNCTTRPMVHLHLAVFSVLSSAEYLNRWLSL